MRSFRGRTLQTPSSATSKASAGDKPPHCALCHEFACGGVVTRNFLATARLTPLAATPGASAGDKPPHCGLAPRECRWWRPDAEFLDSSTAIPSGRHVRSQCGRQAPALRVGATSMPAVASGRGVQRPRHCGAPSAPLPWLWRATSAAGQPIHRPRLSGPHGGRLIPRSGRQAPAPSFTTASPQNRRGLTRVTQLGRPQSRWNNAFCPASRQCRVLKVHNGSAGL